MGPFNAIVISVHKLTEHYGVNTESIMRALKIGVSHLYVVLGYDITSENILGYSGHFLRM